MDNLEKNPRNLLLYPGKSGGILSATLHGNPQGRIQDFGQGGPELKIAQNKGFSLTIA